MNYLYNSNVREHLFQALVLIMVLCQINRIEARKHHEPRSGAPNKITFCTKEGDKYTLETNKCKTGAWLPKPLEVNCICVTGLWAISEHFCDKNFILLAGENQECFEVSKSVRRLISLYNQNDEGDYGKKIILRSNLESFESFSHSTHTKNNENGSYIIRFDETEHELYLRHTEGYQENFWQRCIHSSANPKKFQIIQANGVTFADDKKGCRNSQDLEHPMKKMEKAIWGFSTGQSWHPSSGVGRKSSKCRASCLESTGRRQRQILNSDSPDLEATLEMMSESTKESRVFSLRAADANVSPKGNSSDSSNEILDASEEKYQKIDRDTSKIAYYLKNWNMKKEPGPKLPYKEYKYIQYARIILLKTCPSEFVPVNALTDFLRLFRYLVYESLKKAPEHYSEDINKSAHKRIIASLESCYASAQQMEFSVTNTCPPKVETVTYDGKSFPATLPNNLNYDTDTTDLILETIWKMILHTHYLCSENFVKNGGDLSTMYIKLQEFFTDPHMMLRWENPGFSSNQVYHILFPSLNIPKFVDGINACVAGAQGVSRYTKWLKRPSSNEQKTARIMAKKLTKTSASGRSLNSLPTLFDKKGYCTNSYDDPLLWSKFNTEMNAVCL